MRTMQFVKRLKLFNQYIYQKKKRLFEDNETSLCCFKVWLIGMNVIHDCHVIDNTKLLNSCLTLWQYSEKCVWGQL